MDNQYHPILRIQRGECDALSKLENDVASMINPIWEVPPIPKRRKRDGGGDKLSVEEHIIQCLAKLKFAYSKGQVLRIDANLLDRFSITADGEEMHTLGIIKDKAKEEQLDFIPVLTLQSSKTLIQAANHQSDNGICLRLDVNNLSIESLLEKYNELTQLIITKPEDTDLVIDLKTVTLENKKELKGKAILILQQMKRLSQLRSLSLVSSSYLASMSGIEKDTVLTRRMLEFELWKELKQDTQLLRIPSYGDYALAPADLDYSTPVEFMNPAATIRYSNEDYWIFVKGEQVKGKGGVKGPGWKQTDRLCQILVESSYYKQYGPHFSAGDLFIAERAAGNVSSGAGYTWKDVGINHHATMIATALSSQHET